MRMICFRYGFILRRSYFLSFFFLVGFLIWGVFIYDLGLFFFRLLLVPGFGSPFKKGGTRLRFFFISCLVLGWLFIYLSIIV